MESGLAVAQKTFWSSHDTQFAMITSTSICPDDYQSTLKDHFLYLYKVAKMFVPCIGSSVPCERLFPLAGLIMDDRSNRLSPEPLYSEFSSPLSMTNIGLMY